ncbi:MAG: succinate--CoA ligase subunit alpha [Nitrososphaerales archaeon]
MTILLNRENRVVVQGITGRQGSFHTKLMLEYGTKVLAGVTPGKGGIYVEGLPVYDTVAEAKDLHNVDTSIIFVPAIAAYDAVMESINEGIKLIVVITEGIPPNDTMKFVCSAKEKGSIIIGPNCPGIISPGEAKVGIMPGFVYKKGPIGIVSRSGTLTYEIAWELTKAGIGQSTVIGIGGDPIVGLTFTDALRLFEKDDETEAIVLIGEIGGDAEERVAQIIGKEIKKKIVAYVAGRTAPEGKRMGHAGAIISAGSGTAMSKIKAFKDVGVEVAERPMDIPELVKKVMKK